MTEPRIKRVTDLSEVLAAAHLLDDRPRPEATERFLGRDGHHLLIAYVDDKPVGMITGVEMSHPDKGTEMCLYEFGVEETMRRHGIGGALVAALLDLARERGCYGMWAPVDEDNDAALRAYRGAGGDTGTPCTIVSWEWTR